MRVIFLFSFLLSSFLSAEDTPVGMRALPLHEKVKSMEASNNTKEAPPASATKTKKKPSTFKLQHQILEVNKEEYSVTLEDGSVWTADSSQKHIFTAWRAGDRVTIAPGGLFVTMYQYVIQNDELFNLVFVNLSKVSDEASLRITKIDQKNHTLELSNNTKWKIQEFHWIFMKQMKEQDRMIIGHSKFSTENAFILIDAETDFALEAVLQ